MMYLNTVAKRLLPALLLCAGLALLATSCSRPKPAAPTATPAPVATTTGGAILPTVAPAAGAATTQPTAAATESPLPTPDTSSSPLPAPDTAGSPLPTPDTSSSPVQPPSPFTAAIVVQRTGGLAGVSEQSSIYPDGRVLLPKGTQAQVSAAQVSALLATLDKAGFFTLQDSYGQGSQCADCFNYQLSVNSNGRSKTVSFVEGASDTPPALAAALEGINDLLNQAAQ